MVVADLKIGTVILPRSETPEIVSRLTEFEWFHKIDSTSETVTPEVDDILLKAQQTFQEIDEVIKGLEIPREVGMLEILFKGTVFKKQNQELDELEKMVDEIAKKAPGIIDAPAKLLKEQEEYKKEISDYTTLKETLEVVKKLNVDLTGFGLMKQFYTNLFIVQTKDIDEIKRTLDNVTINQYPLNTKEESALMIIADVANLEKILKVMRSFNANPFSIPENVEQVPTKAYATAELKIKEFEEKHKKVTKEIAKMIAKIRQDILTLHERASVAKDVLELLRKPGGTKNFAVVQGYIPKKMEKKFKDTTGKWMSIVEDVSDPELSKKRPTLFDNKIFVRTFEVITQSQGIPKKGEADPTPMIALMWPIFYGLMFADVGHGLLLMGLGLIFKLKGQGNLSRWGMLIAISGAAAAIAGVGTGEAFGFHINYFDPWKGLLEEGGALHSVSWLVGVISVAELNFEQVIMILKVSLFLGIIHIVWAFILHIRKLAQDGHKTTMFTEAIPNVTLYGGIVVIMMCAIGSGYDVMNMYSKIHTEPVPWVTVFLGDWAQVWIITRIAGIIVIASIVVMMIGGLKHIKAHPEEGGSPANVFMEVLLGKSVECLAHTISYARLGIMLLVHAALLLTVNNSYASLGGMESPGALALLIGGNIGIMMIEGLIVYIQSLRLHLYEFFTKWYDGGAQPFKQVVPEMFYNQFKWNRK
ncbi:MAG: V-type ATPase 116kDa subunit family protein [Thermoproteota archaeon]|uniref:A-type ATP synthase subunit I n=1 Tax=uncultured marine thaumarchaeote KM3_33_B12 TaxID=1456125 RepID=A0A075H2T5_9ARCH|nr:V-type ATP synthase subunit I (ATPVI, ntpI) [uncultured marine thaumarchaeote KM3_33_B12]MEC7707658.1 V-type ATPase 116kDa subunit family protein [Thermoproteota archaeon]